MNTNYWEEEDLSLVEREIILYCCLWLVPPTPSPCIDDTVAISFGKSKTKGQTVHQREHMFDLPPSSPWHNEDSRNYRHYGVIAGTPQSWWEEQQVIILSWDEQMSILVIVWSASWLTPPSCMIMCIASFPHEDTRFVSIVHVSTVWNNEDCGIQNMFVEKCQQLELEYCNMC